MYSIMIHEFIKALAIMIFLPVGRKTQNRGEKMKTFIAFNIKSGVVKNACSRIIRTLKL